MVAALRYFLAALWKRLVQDGVKTWLFEESAIVFYRSLRALGVVNAAADARGRRPRTDAGEVDLRHHWHAQAGIFSPSHPTLTILQKRAIWELYDWLEIEVVPVAFWRVLDATPDPSDALSRFIGQHGVNADLVRRRDEVELERFRTLVVFLCQCEASRDKTYEHQRRHIEALDYFGYHARADALRAIYVALNEAMVLFDTSPGPQRFATYEELAETIHAQRRHVTAVTLVEAKNVAALSREQAKLQWRYRAASNRRASAREFLWMHGQLAGRERPGEERLSDFVEGESDLMTDAACPVPAIVVKVEASADRLAELSDRLAGGASKVDAVAPESPEAVGDPSLGSLLAFFRFDVDAKPSLIELRAAFRTLAEAVRPHRKIDDEIFAGDEYRRAIDYFNRLKGALGYS